MMDIEAMAADVIDASFRIHRDLGPGLLESVYENRAGRATRTKRISCRAAAADILDFDGLHFDAAFRIDILVEGRLLLEIKSIDRLNPVHLKQVLTYLRLMKQPLGLLINFGGATLKEGLRRIVNGYTFAPSRLSVNQSSGD